MSTDVEIETLCASVLEAESDWRFLGPEGRQAAYERFQQLLQNVAEMTGRPYEEVMNEAIEDWIRLHFCSVPDEE